LSNEFNRKIKEPEKITKGLLGGAFYDLDLGVAPEIAEN
jgi:hypothetical protein